MLPLCDAAGLHDPPDTCKCIIHLLHGMKMSGVFVAGVVPFLLTLANSQRGPVLLPSLEKGGRAACDPPSLVSPLPLQRPCTAVHGHVLGRSLQGREGSGSRCPSTSPIP